ncbi:L-glutaminase [Sphingomonas laterariae]|uniref:Glutaminase n=1 Tax=Edaphosphingomonas laterariae TaxID=861865 RepID=A0A239C7E3_9SPHN|nr:glutaminase A [Sphingomonas laterariae]SNS15303.1 L-glutaminase [Sphingomonas laterariae]
MGMDGPIGDFLKTLHAEIGAITDGAPASYIPELAKADPNLCGIAVATVDGAVHVAGDWDHPFTIQSISKAFVYGHALEVHGRERVLRQVGVEPSGDSFNSIALDTVNKRPFNPMVNSGAIATAELIAGTDAGERQANLATLLARFAGRPLPLDEATYLSEKATGHRNRAIAWMMLSAGMIERDPEDVLDLYFRQCSYNVTARDLAIMGATLANDGVNPITGDRALDAEYCPDVLTVMLSCGMYNYAGQWAYEVGLPAKSGVSGGILAVIPGQAAIAIFSPPIDANGNSARALAACKRIAERFGLHLFRTHPDPRGVIRYELDGRQVRSKRTRSLRELEILFRAGPRIRLIAVQDALYFGSTDRLLRRAAELAEQADYLILDMRRVSRADAASRALLAQFHARMQAAGDRLIFANLDADGPLGDLGLGAGTIFESRDRALEYCEDRLIAEILPGGEVCEPRFADFELFRGLDTADLARLEAIAARLSFAAGATIAREGAEGDRFFVLVSGHASVSAEVATPTGLKTVRFSVLGAGQSFGERALIDGGPRTADVIADGPVELLAFRVADVEALAAGHPAILIRLLANMAGELSERLQVANAEIRALER